MKNIICISDTHNKHDKLTEDLKALNLDEDAIIVHAGDCTNGGTQYELKQFLEWYSNLPYRNKILIAGNHDFCFEPASYKVDYPIYPDIPQEYKDKGVIYLMDQMVEVDGVKIYGSPWQPRFFDWAFNVNRGEAIAQKWAKIPEGLDVLVTHGPVFGILDYTYTGMRVGCEDLYMKVMQVRPKVHVCGHIHYGYGQREMDGIKFVNASALGEDYFYQNKPIVVEI